MKRWLALLTNMAVYGVISSLLADGSSEYLLGYTTLIIVGLGAAISAGGSAYAGSEEKKAQESQLQYIQSLAGQLGPLGLVMGGDNLRQVEGAINQLMSEEGLSWLGSPEQQNIGQFYAHIKPDERNFLNEIMAQSRSAPASEIESSEFLRSLLAGEYLPGQVNQNPMLQPVLDSITRNAREAADFQGEQYRSEGSKILGGLSGAGSFLPVYGDQLRDFQTRETDLVNSTYYGMYNDVLGKMVQALGLAPSVQAQPFTRLALGRSAAALPRELRDTGVTRSLGAFENRANRFANATMGLTGMIANNPYPSQVAGMQWPSNAYIGNTISDLGNTLMLAGMMGGGGGGAPTAGGGGYSSFSSWAQPQIASGGGFGSYQVPTNSSFYSTGLNPFSNVTPSTTALNPFGGALQRPAGYR